MLNILSFCLDYKNLNIEIYKTIIVFVVLRGFETWYLTIREENRFKLFE
jgi:hypothetical protein